MHLNRPFAHGRLRNAAREALGRPPRGQRLRLNHRRERVPHTLVGGLDEDQKGHYPISCTVGPGVRPGERLHEPNGTVG
jgi:hypothetical protein